MTTLAEQWMEQGRKQGQEQGLQWGLEQGLEQGLERGLQAMRKSILDLLSIRFDFVAQEMMVQLERIKDLEALRYLLQQAATADSITAVEQAVDKIANE